MNVGEVCNREVVVIGKKDSIREAAKLMRSFHVGNLVVVEERDNERFPVGILTDRDIVIELLAKDIDPGAVDIGDAMSYELVMARDEEDIRDAIKRMKSKGVRRVPVVNKNGVLVGILAMDDLIDIFAEELKDLAELIIREQKREREARF